VFDQKNIAKTLLEYISLYVSQYFSINYLGLDPMKVFWGICAPTSTKLTIATVCTASVATTSDLAPSSQLMRVDLGRVKSSHLMTLLRPLSQCKSTWTDLSDLSWGTLGKVSFEH
jgi:hypothetical protein